MNYAEQIERAFLLRVGRGLMLSPRDLDLVARWECAGLPVEVVLDGIERAFDRRVEGARPVRSLSYVEKAVEEAAKAWRERQVGRPAQLASGAGLAQAFERLLQEIEEASRAAVEPSLSVVLRETWRAVGELADRAAAGNERDPAAALATLEASLTERAMRSLDAETRTELEARVDAALASMRSIADPEALEEARRGRLQRAVRDALGLPALRLDLGGSEW